jgi:hypothetical protein
VSKVKCLPSEDDGSVYLRLNRASLDDRDAIPDESETVRGGETLSDLNCGSQEQELDTCKDKSKM